MPSPFPGMNPYMEQPGVWSNFHTHALTLFVERLVPQVVPAYIVRLEEHVYVRDLADEEARCLGRADLAIGTGGLEGSGRVAVGVIEAPAHVRLPATDVERVVFIEIRDRR